MELRDNTKSRIIYLLPLFIYTALDGPIALNIGDFGYRDECLGNKTQLTDTHID